MNQSIPSCSPTSSLVPQRERYPPFNNAQRRQNSTSNTSLLRGKGGTTSSTKTTANLKQPHPMTSLSLSSLGLFKSSSNLLVLLLILGIHLSIECRTTTTTRNGSNLFFVEANNIHHHNVPNFVAFVQNKQTSSHYSTTTLSHKQRLANQQFYLPLIQTHASQNNDNNNERELLFQYPKGSDETKRRFIMTKEKNDNDDVVQNVQETVVRNDIDYSPSTSTTTTDPVSSTTTTTNSNYSITIEKDAILNLDNNEMISFIKSLYIQGKVIGQIQCTCNDQFKNNNNNNQQEQPEECMTTLLHIGQNGILVSKNEMIDGIADIFIEGTLIGNISCDRLIMTRNGVLIGNINAKSISIEEGATISGMMKCGSDVDATNFISDAFKTSSPTTTQSTPQKSPDVSTTTPIGIHDRQLDDFDCIEQRYTYAKKFRKISVDSDYHHRTTSNDDNDDAIQSSSVDDKIIDHESNGVSNQSSDDNDDSGDVDHIENDEEYRNLLRNLFEMYQLDPKDEDDAKRKEQNENINEDPSSIDDNDGDSTDLLVSSSGNDESIEEIIQQNEIYDPNDTVQDEFESINTSSKIKDLSSASYVVPEMDVENFMEDEKFATDVRDEIEEEEDGNVKGSVDQEVVQYESNSVIFDNGNVQAPSNTDEMQELTMQLSNEDERNVANDATLNEKNDHENNIDLENTLTEENETDEIEFKKNDSIADNYLPFGVNDDLKVDSFNENIDQTASLLHSDPETNYPSNNIPSSSDVNSSMNQSEHNQQHSSNQIEQEKTKIKWASREIGNYIDSSKNVVVPIIDGHTNQRSQVSMKNTHTIHERYSSASSSSNSNAESDQSSKNQNPVGMVDDFGNPLFVSNHSSSTGRTSISANSYYGNYDNLHQNYNTKRKTIIKDDISDINHQFKDDFGNPLIRGADANEVAGYRQIREISAVTREILDAHIRKKKKEAIEKAASKSNSHARIANRYNQVQQVSGLREDGVRVAGSELVNKMPSFLR